MAFVHCSVVLANGLHRRRPQTRLPRQAALTTYARETITSQPVPACPAAALIVSFYSFTHVPAMNRLRNLALLLRSHWKKSVFFSCAAAYGGSVGLERWRIRSLMRVYCEEASTFGGQPLTPLSLPRHVTVILNPEANKRKAKVQFEKYAAPILHCAGLKVSLVQTEARHQAKELMEIMSDTDAVVVAGGDGTVHESITGLLNRGDGLSFPLGIIPLGTCNASAKSMHQSLEPQSPVAAATASAGVARGGGGGGGKKLAEVRAIADATLSVVRESVRKIDVLQVHVRDDEKPVYAVHAISFGLLRDVLAQADKYWYFGSKMKPYLAMLANVIWRRFDDLALPRPLTIEYTNPCRGCSRCFVPPPAPVQVEEKPVEARRWWSAFVPRSKPEPEKQEKVPEEPKEEDLSSRENAECGQWRRHTSDCSLNVLIKNEPNGDRARLMLHEANDSLSKGSLILDAADVRNGRSPKEASAEIPFKDTCVRLTDGLTPDEIQAMNQVSQGETNNNPTDAAESAKQAPKAVASKFTTISIDAEEYPVSDLKIKRRRKAVTVYALPYPLFRI